MTWRTGCAAIIAASATSFATSASAQEGYLGVKGGYASSGITSDRAPNGDQIEESRNRSGFTAGIVGGLGLGAVFRVSAEALYTQKGFKLSADGQEGRVEIDVIEIPVLLNIELGAPDAAVSPRVYGGPWVSLEVSCDLQVQTVQAACDDVPDQAVRKSTDYGFAVGGAVDVLSFRTAILTADARYSVGLRNIDDSPEVGNLNVKTRGVTVSLGLGIPIGG